MAEARGTAVQGLAGATVGFFFGFAAVSLFGPAVRQLQGLTAMAPALAGLLIAVPNLSGSLLRIPFAAMVETTGGRRPFLILLGLAVAGMALIAGLLFLQPAGGLLLPLLLAGGVLAGCGIATFSVGIGQTSYWFPQQRQGRALGLYAGVGNMAPGLFALLLTGLTLPRLGLARSYLVWLGLLVAGTAAYLLLGRNAWYFQLRRAGLGEQEARAQAAGRYGQQLFPSRSLKESLRVSASRWPTWGLVAVYFTTFGGFMALTGWLPHYWQSLHGLSLARAGALTALFSLLASLLRVAGGVASDRFGGERVATASLLTLAAGAVLVALSGSLGPAVAGIVLMAAGMGVGNAAVFKLVPALVPQAVGGASGWIGGLGAFGGFVIPILLAAIAGRKTAGYSRGFLVFAVLAVAALAIIGSLRRASREPEGRKRAWQKS